MLESIPRLRISYVQSWSDAKVAFFSSIKYYLQGNNQPHLSLIPGLIGSVSFELKAVHNCERFSTFNQNRIHPEASPDKVNSTSTIHNCKDKR